MCIICVELAKRTMSLKEASRNLSEVVEDTKETSSQKQHYQKLKDAIEEFDVKLMDQVMAEGLAQDTD